jgi:DNA-binding transcriptional regulator YbjK
MIVISILTALALEQGVEALHHRHLAHEANGGPRCN